MDPDIVCELITKVNNVRKQIDDIDRYLTSLSKPNSIIVSNLSNDIDTYDLIRIFSSVGTIRDITMEQKGTAHISFASSHEARMAIVQHDSAIINDRLMRVKPVCISPLPESFDEDPIEIYDGESEYVKKGKSANSTTDWKTRLDMSLSEKYEKDEGGDISNQTQSDLKWKVLSDVEKRKLLDLELDQINVANRIIKLERENLRLCEEIKYLNEYRADIHPYH